MRLLLAPLAARPLLTGLWLAVVLVLLGLRGWDLALAWWFKTVAPPALVETFRRITVLGDGLWPGVLLPLAVACCWLAGRLAGWAGWRAWALRASYVWLAWAASGLLANLLKLAIGRLRPRDLFERGLYGFEPFNFHANSFPSGHGQTVWAVAAALWFLWPRLWPIWLAYALLVSASRIVISVHFFADVVFGAYLGIAAAVLLWRYSQPLRLNQMYGRTAESTINPSAMG